MHETARALNLLAESYLLDAFGREPRVSVETAVETLSEIWISLTRSEVKRCRLSPTRSSSSEIAARAGGPDDGPVVMLNLNRYRDREAYGRYGEVALRVLEKVGGRILWHADANETVIGDDSDIYDEVIAVWYPSRRGLHRAGDHPRRARGPRRSRRGPRARRARSAASRRRPGCSPDRVAADGRVLAAALDVRGRRAAPLGRARRTAGLGIRPGERLEVAAVHDAFATDVLVRREPGELYALRHDMPLRGAAVDAGRGLGRAARPGHARGHRVDAAPPRRRLVARRDRRARQRRPAHGLRPLGAPAQPRPRRARLAPAAGAAAAQLVRRPRRRRAGDQGLRRAGGARALDGLGPRPRDAACRSAPPLRLPEPSIARLASDGESVIAVGTTTVFRLRLDRDAGRIVIDERWRPRYGPAPDRSYGWDPVITDEHVFWMDNGRNRTDRTMLGSGEQAEPGAAVVGAPRRRRGALGRDQRAALRDRVEPAGLGSRAARSSSPTTPATPSSAPGACEGDELEPLWRRDEPRPRRAT